MNKKLLDHINANRKLLALLLLWRVIGVGQTPCTPGLLLGADQQWWRHRYGRRGGRRMPHILVPHATRYEPSWIFPRVWPHVQVREKEAQANF